MTFFFKSLYNDGTSSIFSLEDKERNQYSKIDRTKLTTFEIYDDVRLVHRLHLEKGQSLILRSKGLIPLKGSQILEIMNGEPGAEIEVKTSGRVLLVGYIERKEKLEMMDLVAIFPDGHTEHLSNWKNAPLNAIQFRPEEMELVSA